MDIILHLCLIGFIALLFFLSRYPVGNKTNLLYPFIIILCVVGMVIIVQSPTYISSGSNATLTFVNGSYTGATSVPITTDFKYPWMINISYVMFWFMALLSWALSRPEKEDTIRGDD
jgi:hypothetical protein